MTKTDTKKPTKKTAPTPLSFAIARRDVLRDAVIAAEAALQQAKDNYTLACQDVLREQEAEDAKLPQCRMVRVRWRSGNVENAGRMVILRRTPGGMLVVRFFGMPDGSESKFKWAEHAGVFRQAEKGSYTSDTRELRDVPREFLLEGASA